MFAYLVPTESFSIAIFGSRFRYAELFSGYRVSTRSVAAKRTPGVDGLLQPAQHEGEEGKKLCTEDLREHPDRNYNSTGTGATTMYYDGNYDGDSEC